MNIACIASDHGLNGGAPWIPMVTKYPASNGPFTWTPGAKLCLGNCEANHQWLFPAHAGKPQQEAAIAEAVEFRKWSLSHCPNGVLYAPFQIPSTNHHGWIDKPEDQKWADAEHWANKIVKPIRGKLQTMLLCTAIYDAVPNPTPGGPDPHAGYEDAYRRGRLELASMVSTLAGLPWAAIDWHLDKLQRPLAPSDIAPKLAAVNEYDPDWYIHWSSDHSFIAEWTANLTDPVAIAAQAVVRANVAPYIFGTAAPDWTKKAFITRRCREIRLAYANQVMEALL